jgi:hypothetical protein
VTDSSAPSAGWFRDANGERRWWDGASWSDGPEGILDRAVARYLQHGYSVVSNSGTRAVVAKRQQVSVLLNLGLALITGGLWLIVLAIRLLNWPADRAVLAVDEWGGLTGEFSS